MKEGSEIEDKFLIIYEDKDISDDSRPIFVLQVNISAIFLISEKTKEGQL